MARVRYMIEIESESELGLVKLADQLPMWEQEPRPVEVEPVPGPFMVSAIPDGLHLLARTQEVTLFGSDEKVTTFGQLNLGIELPDGGSIRVQALLTETHVAELMAHLPRVQANLMAYQEEQALSDGPDDPDDE